MSEYKYISLKDVLKTQSNTPQLEARVESEEELDFHHVSEMLTSKNEFPSNATSSSSFSVLVNGDGEKTMKKKTKAKKKKVLEKNKGRLSALKHSRSDDPLVYKEFGHEDGGVFSPKQDLQVLCQEFTKFSWEERSALKSRFVSESEEEENEDEEEGDEDY